METNPTISMITLNINGLKTQKEEIVSVDEKKIQVYAVYEKHTLDSNTNWMKND